MNRASRQALFSQNLDHHALAALAVEFGVVDLLPGTEVEPALGDRHQHLVPHQKVFQVGIAVGFAGLVVAIVGAERGEFFKPLVDVGDQAVFGVVDIDSGRDVHGRSQDQSFFDFGGRKRFLQFRRDIDELALLLCVEPQVLRVGFHIASTSHKIFLCVGKGSPLTKPCPKT